MAYRFNVNFPRTRLRQPYSYKQKSTIAALLPSRKDISYVATTDTEITCGGSAIIRANYSWNIVSSGITVSDPVILLKLDENTGTTTVDSYGNWELGAFNNNSGWTTGPTAISGNASGLKFNQGGNTNEFLYFSTAKVFPYGNNYTLAAWVNIDDIAFAGFQVIFVITTFNPFGGAAYLAVAGSTLISSFSDNQLESSVNYGLNTTDHQGKWIHVAVTFNNPDLELFIDGVSVANYTNTYPLNSVSGPLNAVLMGGFFDPGFEFYGSIDDARIYSRALSAAEIKSIRIGREYPSVTTALDLKQIVNATQISVQGTAQIRLTANYNVVATQVEVAGSVSLSNSRHYNVNASQILVEGISSSRDSYHYNVVTSQIQLAGNASINNARHYNVVTTQILVAGTALVRDSYHFNVVATQIQVSGTALINNSYHVHGSGGVLASEPVVLLKLDENTGTTTVDSFHNWNLQVFNVNPSNWTTGPTAINSNVSGLKFNQGGDTGEFLYLSTTKNFPYGSNYTIATWVNIDDISSSGFQVICAGACTVGNGAVYIAVTLDAMLVFFADNQSENPLVYGLNTTDHQGKWIHVAVTFKNPDLELFIDGVSVGTSTNIYPLDTAQGPINTLFLGGFSDTGFEFSGAIDDFRIYAKPLTVPEIQSIRIGREYSSVTTALSLKQIVNATQISVQGNAKVRLTANYNVVTTPVVVSGSGVVVALNLAFAEGGVTLAGSAPFRIARTYKVSGEVALAGSANTRVRYNYKYTASSGVSLAGNGLIRESISYIASSGVILAGSSRNRVARTYVVSGGVVVSGTFSQNRELEATGGVILSGESLAAFFSPFDDNFGFIFTLDFEYLDILNLLVKEYYDELYESLAESFSMQNFKFRSTTFRRVLIKRPKISRIQRITKMNIVEEKLHIVEGQALQPKIRKRPSVGAYARELEKSYRGET